MALRLPIVDLANDSPAKQAETIKDALGTIGFFQVQNSGLDPDAIQRMFDLTREVFEQPTETKETFSAVSHQYGSGYYKPHEQALGVYKRDNKEAFLYGRQTAHTPQDLPAPFASGSTGKARLENFYRDCHETSQRLLELFAMALNLPVDHFREAHSFGLNTATSMIHYPPIPVSDQAVALTSDIRSGEHKDWGTLTLLFQLPGGQPGLQVYLPRSAVPDQEPVDTDHRSEYTFQGEWGWYNAPIPPQGGFLVNVGLAMELWSGGAYKATLHRVIFPPSQPGEELKGRYSMTMFVQPDDDVEIRPVMSSGQIDMAAPAITSKELFGGKLKESLERIKVMPERLR